MKKETEEKKKRKLKKMMKRSSRSNDQTTKVTCKPAFSIMALVHIFVFPRLRPSEDIDLISPVKASFAQGNVSFTSLKISLQGKPRNQSAQMCNQLVNKLSSANFCSEGNKIWDRLSRCFIHIAYIRRIRMG